MTRWIEFIVGIVAISAMFVSLTMDLKKNRLEILEIRKDQLQMQIAADWIVTGMAE